MKGVNIKKLVFTSLLSIMIICAFVFGISLSLKTDSNQIFGEQIISSNLNNSGSNDVASEGYQFITGYTIPTGIESIETDTSHPWTVYSTGIIQSGNIGVKQSLSIMKIIVKGSGALMFDLRVYSDDTELQPDSLLVSVGTQITTSTTYTSFSGDRYYGNTGWIHKTISINTQNDSDLTIVYLAYKKNGSDNAELNTVDRALIKNIVFNTEEVTITASSTNETFGSVSGSGSFFAGESVTLTATELTGGKFYGWTLNGERLDVDLLEYTFTAGANCVVQAVFGSSTLTTSLNRNTGLVYESVAQSLLESTSGDVIELVNNAVLSENAVIPQGVTLYIPYSSVYDSDGNSDGTTSDSQYMAKEDKTYISLTVSENVSLTVRGNLLIGGVISYPQQMYQGHTSGAHGRITNNGSILVDGGRIDCYGFIDGRGTVNATSGDVYEPFIVFDFAGGNNCLELYLAGQNSFTEYTSQNISCTLTISQSAKLGCYCNLYASSEYNKIDVVLIGNVKQFPTALVAYFDGSVVTRTVDKTKVVPNGAIPTDSKYGADIGKVKYSVSGGANLNNLDMTVWGFSISVDKFPIPYCYEYELSDGDYVVTQGWNIMPGASLTVCEDASLTINGSLYVLDGLINNGMSGRYYPSSQSLMSAGFSPSGELLINGMLTLKQNCTFGGIIQSTTLGAKVVVEQGAKVSNPSVQFGANAKYDDNTCIMDLNGRINTADGVITLASDKTYEVTNVDSWVNESYTVNEYADYMVTTKPTEGKYSCIASSKKSDGTYGQYKVYSGPQTVTINKTMYGLFGDEGSGQGSSGGNVVVVNKTYYDNNDSTRTEVADITLENGNVSFKVNKTLTGKSYNYIVKYSIGENNPVIIKPNTNGVYNISNIQSSVTITVTSVLKGDVNLDGEVAGNDVTKLRRFLAGYTTTLGDDFNKAGADCNGDGEVAGNDVTRLRRYLAGYIDEL